MTADSRPKPRPSNPRRDRDLEVLARIKALGREGLVEPPAPPQLSQALEEFNQGQFFKCHDTLEALWLAEGYPTRLFYQGILKVAVGFHHLQRGNRRGAKSKLKEGVELLEPFAPMFMGVEVERLREEVKEWVRRLEASAGTPDSTGGWPKVALTCKRP